MTQVVIEKQPYLSDYDVVIIGAGIVGSMIARELSKFDCRLALLDKETFSGFGVTKGGPSLLHSPVIFPTGPLRAKLAFDAPLRYRKLSDELDVVFSEFGELFLALEPSQIANLESDRKWAEEHHVSTGHKIIGPEKIRELEPHVTKKAVAALYGKGLGGIEPVEWTFALTENAVQNGVHLYLKTTVGDIKKEKDFAYVVLTQKGYFKTRYIINAAGLFADEIAWMVGDRDICLTLTKGTMVIFDKSVSYFVRNMVYGTHSNKHSQLITPTSDGNLMLGLGYFTTPEHKGDTKVTREKLQEVIKMGKELVPTLSESDIITSFAGIRSENNKASDGDFYIAHSEQAPGVIHAIIGSPGLTAAPGIAELVIKMLLDAGMDMEEKKTFQKKRIGWPQFSTASPKEQWKMIASNPKYGHIICRCEQVTEAEILEAIRRGADTLDAVKHLTRAGMGRCQGGFCGTFVLNLLAKQLGIPPNQVTKNGEGSHQITALASERAGFIKEIEC
ncbi:MAG: FAD-dependent oxidoreductase [Deltaproteobacteria bacterium]|nr:FAD-dependent oxidoreductase [Deltaproteobacteria bacterium]